MAVHRSTLSPARNICTERYQSLHGHDPSNQFDEERTRSPLDRSYTLCYLPHAAASTAFSFPLPRLSWLDFALSLLVISTLNGEGPGLLLRASPWKNSQVNRNPLPSFVGWRTVISSPVYTRP